MAWIRLDKSVIVNSDKLSSIAIRQGQIEGVSYYILFSIDRLTTFSSKNLSPSLIVRNFSIKYATN